jgi:hypothetical protein
MDDEKKNELIVGQQKTINGVAYEAPPETTIAVSRTHERQFFQRNEYTSSSGAAICDWNSGAKLVNPRRSYLTFFVRATQAVPVPGTDFITSVGRGSACNFIQRIVITSRSGTELSRTDNFNVLAQKLLRYECPADYLEKFGDAIGWMPGGDAATGLPPAWAGTARIGTDSEAAGGANAGRRFIIPLELLSGFFKGDGKTLIPPQLAAGLRVELTFAPFLQAVSGIGGAATDYIVESPSFMLSTTMMVDSWQRRLNMESARDGLTYAFCEWYSSQAQTPVGGTAVSIEIRKSVARALKAWVVSKEGTANANDKDNLASFKYQATSYEWRLGSLYPSQQPIATPLEGYFIAQNSVDGGIIDCGRPNNVSPTDFLGGTGPAGVGDGMVAVNLERSDVAINNVLNIGGLPSNNSRVLSVGVNMTAAPADGLVHYVFLKHLRMVKAFSDNVVLSE